MKIKTTRRLLADEAYAWSAAGPGWANAGISAPVEVIEMHEGKLRQRRETYTAYHPSVEGFDAAICLQRLMARTIEAAFNAESSRPRRAARGGR